MKTKLYFLIAFILASLNSFSQPVIEWQNTIGGNSTDALYDLRQTSDGGYILGGYSNSNIAGDKTENCWGDYDYWVVKLDDAGNIQWQNTIGGNDKDELHSIEQTSDGGYILGGFSQSGISGDKTENIIGYDDYWIVKLDVSGNIQWQNTIGGYGSDQLICIKQTFDGGYIVGGGSESDSSGDKTENCQGGYDYWILKLDASGNILWQNTIGGNSSDVLYSIDQTSDSSYVLAGYSTSNISGDKTENNAGGGGSFDPDCWIIKLDASGNIQWQNTIGGNHHDVTALGSVHQTIDKGYIIGGSSRSDISGDKTENCFGGFDYWVIKLDSTGSIIWQKTIGGNNDDQLHELEMTSDGGYILGGHSTSGLSGNKTENSIGYFDYWVVKLNASGAIDWQKIIGGIGFDRLFAIQQTTDGNYILGGESGSNISGDKAENCLGGLSADYWVVKLTDKFNSITGKLFIDANSNALQDAGEFPLTNRSITEINTGRFNFSNQSGTYSVSVLDSGSFSVYPAPVNYYSAVPAAHAAYFSGINQTDSLNDFAFQPAGLFNDLCVTITPMGRFRPNMNANYMINYENVGTTTLNGTVIFFPDSNITYVSSNPTATSVTTDSVVWNVGTLTPFQTGSILVTVHVNAGTPIGTLINSSVIIEPVAGDANTACNYNSWEVLVTGAADPNAILVDRDTVLTTELLSPPYLNYIIWFQNTGNDTAFNARVQNNIPQTLDINSFEFVASSHPMNITYGAHARLMTFTFDNILLPDSNVNEPGSHGFIRYRIKPLSTLAAGDSIKNNAAIYFDFNEPVMTDTALTEIVLPTGSPTLTLPGGEGIALAPNPATNVLTVSLAPPLRGGRVGLVVYDLFGRKVFQSEILNPESKIQINVSRFSQGIYFVALQSGEQVLRGKFLKE